MHLSYNTTWFVAGQIYLCYRRLNQIDMVKNTKNKSIPIENYVKFAKK